MVGPAGSSFLLDTTVTVVRQEVCVVGCAALLNIMNGMGVVHPTAQGVWRQFLGTRHKVKKTPGKYKILALVDAARLLPCRPFLTDVCGINARDPCLTPV